MSSRGQGAAVIVAASVLLAACSGSGGAGPSPTSTPSTTSTATTRAPTSTPASSSSEVVVPPLPPSVAYRLPSLPANFGTGNPCGQASTALTGASAYVAVAQLGQTAAAQLCVRGADVPAATTKSLTASSVGSYFVPDGATTGTTIGFRRIDGSKSVQVTVVRAGTGYAVTRVVTG